MNSNELGNLFWIGWSLYEREAGGKEGGSREGEWAGASGVCPSPNAPWEGSQVMNTSTNYIIERDLIVFNNLARLFEQPSAQTLGPTTRPSSDRKPSPPLPPSCRATSSWAAPTSRTPIRCPTSPSPTTPKGGHSKLATSLELKLWILSHRPSPW